MPFGEKPDASGAKIDFDDVYEFMIRGAIEDDLELECIRCDKITEPGLIHADMLKEIFEADVAVVDITTTNANVFYELGVRHALRKGVTVVIRRRAPTSLQHPRSAGFLIRPSDPDHGQARKVMPSPSGRAPEHRDRQPGPPVPRCARERTASDPGPHHLFSVKDVPGKAIGLVTGDIQDVKTVDIWVNSENTNMQMARCYDGSISGVIRFLGSKRNDVDEVENDIVALELNTKMAQAGVTTVSPHR
jgi:hypothetical protein